MSLDDAPRDELDGAICREVAVLRDHLAKFNDTDVEWQEFEAALAGRRVISGVPPTSRRWLGAIAAGAVAALIAALVVVQTSRQDTPLRLPDVTTPATPDTTVVPVTTATPTSTPATSGESSVGTTAVNDDGELVATRPDGTRQSLGQIPSVILASERIVGGWAPGATPYVGAFVSSTGWVAITGMVSEGFWFYDLGDSSRAPRFVDLAGLPGGHTSAGSWNPAGTLFAAVELGRTAAIIDPATGEISRLDSTDAPLGYPPTWTADGSGLLTGSQPPACVTADPTVSRSLGIVPIDGGPEITMIPALADGRNLVAPDGIWAHDDTCGPESSAGITPISDVVVVGPHGPQSWVGATDVAPAVLSGSAFASTRSTLWVVALDSASGQIRLYDVTAPSDIRLANVVEEASVDGEFALISSVAADDSAVVVLVDGPGSRRSFVLVPTDGSPTTTLEGEFGGFVPLPLLDALETP